MRCGGLLFRLGPINDFILYDEVSHLYSLDNEKLSYKVLTLKPHLARYLQMVMIDFGWKPVDQIKRDLMKKYNTDTMDKAMVELIENGGALVCTINNSKWVWLTEKGEQIAKDSESMPMYQ